MSPISLHISLFSFVPLVPSSSWYATTCVTRKFFACVGCREEFGGQKVRRLALAEMSYTPSCMSARRRQNRKTDECHGSDRDACLQGRPGVARPSTARTKNIGRKECQESQRKHVDRLDGSGREY